MFQISCGMANGTSSRQKLIHGLSPEVARRLLEFGRNGAQRLIEAERHVPGLAGENRKNGGVFGAQHAAGRQRHEEHHGHRNEAEDRNRLQNVEQRHEDALGIFVLGRQRRIGERENQREHHRDQHAQRRACRVFGQMARIERRRLLLQLGQRLEQMAARLAEKDQEAEHQKEREHVPAAEQPGPAPDRDWDVHAHARCPAVTERSKKSRPRPAEAASDRDHITPTLCHSNLFAAATAICPGTARPRCIAPPGGPAARRSRQRPNRSEGVSGPAHELFHELIGSCCSGGDLRAIDEGLRDWTQCPIPEPHDGDWPG